MPSISWSIWKRWKTSRSFIKNTQSNLSFNIAVIRSYFCVFGWLLLICFLSFCKVFLTCNAKQLFSSSNQLVNAAGQGEHKPELVQISSKCSSVTLIKKTFHFLVQRLKVLLIWLKTCWIKIMTTYSQQDSKVIPSNVILVGIGR